MLLYTENDPMLSCFDLMGPGYPNALSSVSENLCWSLHYYRANIFRNDIRALDAGPASAAKLAPWRGMQAWLDRLGKV